MQTVGQLCAQMAGEHKLLGAGSWMRMLCGQTWKHSASLSEGLPNGTEAQDDVQVGAHTLQEVGIQSLPSLSCALPSLLEPSPHPALLPARLWETGWGPPLCQKALHFTNSVTLSA